MPPTEDSSSRNARKMGAESSKMDRSLLYQRLGMNSAALERFCAQWEITELAVFGSILRDDFRPDSDLDLLITFAADAPWSLWDFIAMKQEFEQLAGRSADLIEKSALRNPYLRHEVLRTQEVIYASSAA
jgi:hypothetical protein